MHLPAVNYLAVLVGGVVIFMLGGLWYSPVLFAKKWLALMGKTEAEMKAAAATSPMPLMYLSAFLCGLISSWVLAIILHPFTDLTPLRGALAGGLCWLGFAGVTSYANAVFTLKPKMLWLIDSGFNLVSFVLVGVLLAVWR
jgi:hypothetical protein